MRWEHRSELALPARLPDAAFALATDPPDDPAEAVRGAREREFHQGFAGLGILRNDGDKSRLTTADLGPGLVFAAGDSYNSLLVEQAAGVVLIEAPLGEARSRALAELAAQRFPGKRITHVVVTHHHEDHMAGVRYFVAAGAQIVIAAEAEAELRRVAAAPSRVIPDRQAAVQAAPRARVVGADPVTLADPLRPLIIRPLANGHAATMLAAIAPTAGLVFESDLWDPPFPPISLEIPTWERDLAAFVAAYAPAATLIVPGHGAPTPVAELRAVIAAGP